MINKNLFKFSHKVTWTTNDTKFYAFKTESRDTEILWEGKTIIKYLTKGITHNELGPSLFDLNSFELLFFLEGELYTYKEWQKATGNKLEEDLIVLIKLHKGTTSNGHIFL